MGIQGKWKNQLGSVLDIQSIHPQTGLLSGQYQTTVGEPEATKQAYEVTGYAKDKLVGLTVSYGDANCICCWAGRLEADDRIHTVWHFVGAEILKENPKTGAVEASPSALWESFRIQADVFERIV